VEKIIVGGVVGLTRRRTIPIHHRPQLPTLILTNHIPIAMTIITSHFTQSHIIASHRTTMPIRARVQGRTKKGKVLSTMGRPPNRLKANPTPWRPTLHNWRL